MIFFSYNGVPFAMPVFSVMIKKLLLFSMHIQVSETIPFDMARFGMKHIEPMVINDIGFGYFSAFKNNHGRSSNNRISPLLADSRMISG
jgi:hypothetical protein